MPILDPRLTAASDKIEELQAEIERLSKAYISVVRGRKTFRGLYLKAKPRLAKADALAEAVEARLQSQSLLEDDQPIFAMRMALTSYQGKEGK